MKAQAAVLEVTTNAAAGSVNNKRASSNSPLAFDPPSLTLFPKDRLIEYQHTVSQGAGLKNVGPKSKANAFCVSCMFEKHVTTALSGQYEWITPTDFLSSLSRLGEFHYGQQEDAHEFLRVVLSQIHTELHENSIKELKPTFKDRSDQQRVEETTLIYQIFGGYLRSLIKCKECQADSARYEAFTDLNLDLTNAFSLEEALDRYINIETIERSCEKCNCKMAEKQMTIYAPPNFLCLQLKRFDVMQHWRKINKNIIFAESLDLTKHLTVGSPYSTANYELYAVVVHYGPSTMVGHYCAFVKCKDSWCLFDDERVTQLPNISVVLKQNPYLFFYRRVENKTQQKPASTPSSAPGASSKPKSPLSQSREDVGSKVSTVTTPTPAPAIRQFYVPSFNFYFDATDEGSILGFTLTFPLQEAISPNDLILRIPPDYGILLTATTSKAPFLLFPRLPFELSLREAYVCEDNVIVIRLDHYHPNDVKVEEIQVEGFKHPSSELKINRENEVDDIEALSPPTSTDEAAKFDFSSLTSSGKRSKIDAELERKERENRESHESSYPSLYQQIASAWDLQKKLDADSASSGQKTNLLKPASKSAPKVVEPEKKIGRNDQCMCGSGRKYKVCHGKNA